MSARIPHPGSGSVFAGKPGTSWFGGRGALPVPVRSRPGVLPEGKHEATIGGLAGWACSPLGPGGFRRRGVVTLLGPGTARTEEEIYDRDSSRGEERVDGSCGGGKPGVQRYLLAVEYIGTRFSGSQFQPERRTVVGVLQDAFQEFIGRPVTVVCSSRTDSGVHALSNVCHADVERISKRKPGEVLTPHDPIIVERALNHFLQKSGGDIRIIKAAAVSSDFNARFRAKERVYFYRLLFGRGPLTLFERGLAWQVPEDLDILAMRKACSVLVGCHDFTSFRGARCQAKSPVKTLDELNVFESHPSMFFPSYTGGCQHMGLGGLSSNDSDLGHSPDGSTATDMLGSQLFGQREEHRCVIIKARARSFLYHQVRLLVGVLKSVGTGSLTVDDVQKILDAKTVTASGPMAPACGLYLGGVKYDPF